MGIGVHRANVKEDVHTLKRRTINRNEEDGRSITVGKNAVCYEKKRTIRNRLEVNYSRSVN